MDLDLIATPLEAGAQWELADLLGRPVGRIASASAEQFTIHADGQSLEAMAGIAAQPFATLDAALAAIEKHTRSAVRRAPGQDQG